MERKKALIAAASAALVVATSGAAIATNLSLLGADGGDVGQLDAESVTNLVDEQETTSTTAPAGEVIVVDEWVTDPAAATTGGAVDPGVTGVDLSGDGLPDDHPTTGSSTDDSDDDSDDAYEDEDDDDAFEDEDSDEDEDHEDEDEVEHEDDD